MDRGLRCPQIQGLRLVKETRSGIAESAGVGGHQIGLGAAQCPWAILGNARREPWEIWHSWQRGICKLQILGAYRGFESHPHRQGFYIQ